MIPGRAKGRIIWSDMVSLLKIFLLLMAVAANVPSIMVIKVEVQATLKDKRIEPQMSWSK
ncbi:MAG: hypothetical protein ACN4GW_20830 [Desulforhopalus sp.]